MSIELIELKSQKDIKRFKQLMNLLHPQGHPQGAVYAKGWRFWALVNEKGEWLVLMSTHLLNNYKYSQQYRLKMDRTVFLRRILTLPREENVAVEALRQLIERLRSEGYHALITLSLPRHSGALYRHAGMTKVGESSKGHGIWLLKLK